VDALSFIDDVKGYFFLDEISVFTPQGELRTLPANSTVLDFAYAIHSELGNTCIGAKVDKRLTPINQILRNGQQVELITSRKQAPREDWLNYVVTTRAKSNIKLALREEKKKLYRPGKEKMNKWFLQMGIPFNHENISKFLTTKNYSSQVDLFFAAAQDKIGLKDVKLFAASSFRDDRINLVTNKGRAGAQTRPEEVPGPASQYLPGMVKPGGVYFEVAACCNPSPGDDVIGILGSSDKKPIQIHRTKCNKAQEMVAVFGHRMVRVNWTNLESLSYMTVLKIKGMDRMGFINEITCILSCERSLSIKSFHLEGHDGLTEGVIDIFVQDTATLKNALAKLKKVEGIMHITRME
jgi:GTP pyrophosphokinase